MNIKKEYENLPYHLQSALIEHDLRQEETQSGIKHLSRLSAERFSSVIFEQEEKEKLLDKMKIIIKEDILIQTILNEYVVQYSSSIPLKTNKNLILFNICYKLLDNSVENYPSTYNYFSMKNDLITGLIDDLTDGKYDSLCTFDLKQKTLFPNHIEFTNNSHVQNAFGSFQPNIWQYCFACIWL